MYTGLQSYSQHDLDVQRKLHSSSCARSITLNNILLYWVSLKDRLGFSVRCYRGNPNEILDQPNTIIAQTLQFLPFIVTFSSKMFGCSGTSTSRTSWCQGGWVLGLASFTYTALSPLISASLFFSLVAHLGNQQH